MSINKNGKFTFPGGIHPPEYKELAKDQPIAMGPAPKQLAIMLSQHIGAPCQAKVAKNDKITTGMKIGDADAFVCAPIHAPAAGKVKQISLQSHPVMQRSMAVVIDVDSESEQKTPVNEKFSADMNIDSYSPQQICEAVRNAGIVGMGGAGFPTHVKIVPDNKSPKHTLLINACECEPFITCDYRIMLEWTDQIIAGIRLAQKAADTERVVIAIEDNKPLAIETMKRAIEKLDPAEKIDVVALQTKYPQGGERQLIKSVLDTQVGTGKIPPMIGVVVMNVATAAAVAEAVVLGTPLTHRVVTVTGPAIKNPGNFYCAIGTTVAEIIERAGGLTESAARVILGGPMMGFAISDMNTPITKTTGAITILTAKEIGAAKFQGKRTPCIRCGRCLQACPEHLNPTKIAHAVKYDKLDIAESYFINACIECGCCSYVCPANLDITGYIKTGKILLARQKKKMPQ